uniref:Uncharacterized protein n=1 Tax=Anguilla anguilla TaxID=7936 RepID=A0A0E9V8D0_ANGAN
MRVVQSQAFLRSRHSYCFDSLSSTALPAQYIPQITVRSVYTRLQVLEQMLVQALLTHSFFSFHYSTSSTTFQPNSNHPFKCDLEKKR